MVSLDKVKEVKDLLKEMFQFEQSDLDFGIYRIMNIKRNEIQKFIDEDLVKNIENEFSKANLSENVTIKEELFSLKIDLEETFGEEINDIIKNYSDKPKVKKYIEKREELKSKELKEEKEIEIYDEIISFFSRYYDKGDFISKRRYSTNNNKYAIPYNGEEVMLYWANNDQYYIKTTENFNYYSFKAKNLKVEFKIESEDDVEVEKNNNKTDEKRFFIVKDVNYDSSNKLLIINFRYESLTKKEEEEIINFVDKKTINQDFVNQWNINFIKEKIGIYGLNELNEKAESITGEKINKNILEWNLNKYTKKNSSDYFIHKNLGEFLKKEIDFYIKNEILHLDDIGISNEILNINLEKIKVFKEISLKIINFLAQIEDFQKMLWRKKKFVIESEYCITLDYIDEVFYPKILENKKQLEEWKNLFNFDIEIEIKRQKTTLSGLNSSNDIKIELLKNNPTLTIDTKYYDEILKFEILSSINNLEDNINGLLINSENFQALKLLQNKFKNKIKCVYIDPPYNTGSDGFLYKDGFNHSSWLSFMENRLIEVKNLMTETGVIFTSIANNSKYYSESYNLNLLNKQIFDKRIGELIWKRRSGAGSNTIFDLTEIHEYILVYSNEKGFLYKNLLSADRLKEYSNKDDNGVYRWNDVVINQYTKETRPNLFYSVIYNKLLNKLIFEERKLEDNEILIFPSKTGNSVFFCDKNSMEEINKRNILSVQKHKSKDEYYIKIKKYLYGDGGIIQGNVLKTILHENDIPDKIGGTADGTKIVKDLFGYEAFIKPKPVNLIKLLSYISSYGDDYILDYFAGSGTTGHSILNLNKEDKNNRKFILIEMGKYFNDVLKPRIQKIIFTENWKDGKPVDNNGSKKQIIKYQLLEQYEDTLNNIDFKQPNSLAVNSRDYLVKYMLSFESKENNVFLNLDNLSDPFNYKLKFIENNEIKEKTIDLIETFNYINNIKVKSLSLKYNNNRKYQIVKGLLNDEQSVIVIWRDTLNSFDIKKDKEFVEKEILIEEFDEIYVNGNSAINNAKSLDDIFKAKLFD